MQVGTTQTGGTANRIAGLDGLRALSIAIVYFSHLESSPGFPWHIAVIEGRFGVEIFFTISGFLITELLLREEEKFGGFSVPGFYYRRAFRILPPALTFIAAVGIVSIAWRPLVKPKDMIAAALFTENFLKSYSPALAHYWSLSVEEQFYLLWPAFLLLVPRRLRLPLAMIAMAGIPFWFQLNMKVFNAANLNGGRLDLNADRLLSGAIVALGFRNAAGRRAIDFFVRHANASLLISFITLFAFRWGVHAAHLPGTVSRPLEWLRQAAASVLIISAINARGAIAGALNARSVRYVGRLSYSMYLWQQPFLWSKSWFVDVPWLAHWPQNLVFAFVAALTSYHFIELPILAWRTRHPYSSARLS